MSPGMQMWDSRYGEDGWAYGTAPNGFLKERVDALCEQWGGAAGKKVLCLAEGEGRNAFYLAEKGFAVTAVDFSEIGIAKLKKEADSRKLVISAQVADLTDYDMTTPGGYDLIVSIFAHMPSDTRKGAHARVAAALAPGGRMILEAYTPANIGRNTGGPQDAPMCMTLEGLRVELAGLEEEHGAETERAVVEGKYHMDGGAGSAVVQFVACNK